MRREIFGRRAIRQQALGLGAIIASVACRATSLQSSGPAVPGPETELINRFTRSATWSGKLPAKTPGGPELTTKGHMTCRWFARDWWNLCDIVDNIGTGPDARQWTAYWVSGWDSGRKEYRGFIFDSDGTSSEMRGRLEGEKLIYESMTDVVMRGKPTRLRFTFDSSHPKGIDFTAERTVDGNWTLIEREVHVPVRADAR
jgi:hypothetical protein